jgi:hypothetical protein
MVQEVDLMFEEGMLFLYKKEDLAGTKTKWHSS